jgi:hypothetical protein
MSSSSRNGTARRLHFRIAIENRLRELRVEAVELKSSSAEMPMHLDERTDYLVGSIPKSSALPLFLCHFPILSDTLAR